MKFKADNGLTRALAANGWNVVDLARESGIPQSTLYNYTNGKRDIGDMHISTAFAICDALGIDPRDLLSGAPRGDDGSRHDAPSGVRYVYMAFGLNEDGMEKLRGYADDLKQIDRYVDADMADDGQE